MNKKIKALWVAALRSGEYKQGHRQLRSGDKFCCLGVLCNLHAQAHPKVAAKETDPILYMGRLGFLPPAVVKWAGLQYDYGARVTIKAFNGSLSHHNDSGRTFNEIADAIEAQL